MSQSYGMGEHCPRIMCHNRILLYLCCFQKDGSIADDLIVQRCALLSPDQTIIVVTDDKELISRVKHLGGNTITADCFAKTLPKSLVLDATDNQAIEQQREDLNDILYDSTPASTLSRALRNGRLKAIVPDLFLLRDIPDTHCHHANVLDHTLAVVEQTSSDIELRLAALLQDVGKHSTRKKRKKQDTFYQHEVVGIQNSHKAFRGFVIFTTYSEERKHSCTNVKQA